VLRRTVWHWRNFVEGSWRLRPNLDLDRVRWLIVALIGSSRQLRTYETRVLSRFWITHVFEISATVKCQENLERTINNISLLLPCASGNAGKLNKHWLIFFFPCWLIYSVENSISTLKLAVKNFVQFEHWITDILWIHHWHWQDCMAVFISSFLLRISFWKFNSGHDNWLYICYIGWNWGIKSIFVDWINTNIVECYIAQSLNNTTAAMM